MKSEAHQKESTRERYRVFLRTFPAPEKLNAKHFRKRMKDVSPYTLRQEHAMAKRVLKFLKMKSDLDELKLPRRGESVTVEDLYSQEELRRVFDSTTETQMRAVLKVLYESACRASEVLSMTFENLTFHEDGTITAIVKGKTGTREVYLKESVPALKKWIDVHPSKSGHVWRSLKNPDKKMSYRTLYRQTAKVLKRAELKREKKRLVHMFRHTRITELVRMGVRGQTLHKLVGWTKGSNMEQVYVHLSTTDVENEVRAKVFGQDTLDKKPRPLLESKTCPRCGTVNEEESVICAECNMPLSDEGILKAVNTDERIKNLESELQRHKKTIDEQRKLIENLTTPLKDEMIRERVREILREELAKAEKD